MEGVTNAVTMGTMDDISPAGDLFARPRAALDAGDWGTALERLDSSREAAESGEGLELRSAAAYGNGDLEDAVTALEDLHHLHLRRGDRHSAAQAGAVVAMFLMMDTGLMAPVRGWIRRSETLVVGSDESTSSRMVGDGSHI
jgi:hypothetical protein